MRSLNEAKRQAYLEREKIAKKHFIFIAIQIPLAVIMVTAGILQIYWLTHPPRLESPSPLVMERVGVPALVVSVGRAYTRLVWIRGLPESSRRAQALKHLKCWCNGI